MGKWAARLSAKTGLPLAAPTDKTDEIGLVSVLAVPPEGGANDFWMAPNAAEPAPNSPDLSAVCWTDGDIANFNARRARLMRWGWPEVEAEATAERLVLRDRAGDDLVSCTECQHYRPGRCGNARRAGLHSAEVGRDLAAMPQRCPGFRAGYANQPYAPDAVGCPTKR